MLLNSAVYFSQRLKTVFHIWYICTIFFNRSRYFRHSHDNVIDWLVFYSLDIFESVAKFKKYAPWNIFFTAGTKFIAWWFFNRVNDQADTVTLWQRCHNVAARSKMSCADVGFPRCDNVALRRYQDVATRLLQRCHNIKHWGREIPGKDQGEETDHENLGNFANGYGYFFWTGVSFFRHM